MIRVLIECIVVLILAGVFVWGARKILSLCDFLDARIRQVIDVLIIIIAVIAVVVYGVIPVLHALGSLVP